MRAFLVLASLAALVACAEGASPAQNKAPSGGTGGRDAGAAGTGAAAMGGGGSAGVAPMPPLPEDDAGSAQIPDAATDAALDAAADSGPAASCLADDTCTRKKITVDETLVDAELTNFVVLVQLSGDGPLMQARSDGLDLFFSSDGKAADLDFEIEHFNRGAGDLVAWVRLPTVSSGAPTVFYLRHGDGSDTDRSNAGGVWDTTFAAVYHMDYGGGSGTQFDASGNGNDVSPNAAGQEPADLPDGHIGRALTFGGPSDMLRGDDAASLDMSTALTMSVWVYPTGASPGRPETLISKRIAVTEVTNYQLTLASGSRNLTYFDGDFSPNPSQSTVAVSAGVWTHVVLSVSGGDVVYYTNGSVVQTKADAELVPNDHPIWIGGTDQETDEALEGHLDEVRIANVVRSTAWIRAEYENQREGSGFLSYEDE